MGRPPIGRMAMSSTERVRRYRERRADRAETKLETKHDAAMEREITSLKARIAELEVRNCKLELELGPAWPARKLGTLIDDEEHAQAIAAQTAWRKRKRALEAKLSSLHGRKRTRGRPRG